MSSFCEILQKCNPRYAIHRTQDLFKELNFKYPCKMITNSYFHSCLIYEHGNQLLILIWTSIKNPRTNKIEQMANVALNSFTAAGNKQGFSRVGFSIDKKYFPDSFLKTLKPAKENYQNIIDETLEKAEKNPEDYQIIAIENLIFLFSDETTADLINKNTEQILNIEQTSENLKMIHQITTKNSSCLTNPLYRYPINLSETHLSFFSKHPGLSKYAFRYYKLSNLPLDNNVIETVINKNSVLNQLINTVQKVEPINEIKTQIQTAENIYSNFQNALNQARKGGLINPPDD